MAVSRLNRNFKTAVVNGEFEKAEKLYKEGADIDNMSLIIHLADSETMKHCSSWPVLART